MRQTLLLENEINQELNEYKNHLEGKYHYTIQVEPIPAPRVRARIMYKGSEPFVHMYNPADYTKAKSEVLAQAKKIIQWEVPQNRFYVTFYIPYPASTPKKKLIDGAPHKKQKDVDNFVKFVLDGLQGSPKQGIEGIIKNDASIDTCCAKKVYTTQPKGYISFSFY